MPALNPELIRFVYFDLDDTLLDHRKAEKRALADVVSHFKGKLADQSQQHVEDVYHQGNVKLWHDYADRKITKAELRVLRFEHLLKAFEVKALDPSEVGAYYMNQYGYYWDYCEGAREAFAQIASALPVGVLTNGFAEVQHKKMAQFSEIQDQIQTFVISEEVGHWKPDSRLFNHAAKLAGAAPEEIVYVGDSIRSDVEGGTNAGWNVIWYAPEGEGPSDVLRARDWRTIVELLNV